MYFLIIFLSLRSDVKPLVPFTVFRHFNTNGKKFTVSINFSVKNKIGSKRIIIFCIVYQVISATFRQFPIISRDLQRLSKISEDQNCLRWKKTTDDFRGGIWLFSSLFRHHIFTCERCILSQCTDTTFSARESYVIHSN